MPSQTITSDAVLVAPVTATITSDAVLASPRTQSILGDRQVVAPKTQSIVGDRQIVPPVTSTILSDREIVEPRTSVINSDVFFVGPYTNWITSDAFLEAPAIPEFIGQGGYCQPYLEPMVEGVDYILDEANGLVKFLSTGVLGGLVNNLYSGLCGVSVDACCQESGCVYLDNPAPPSCDGGCYVQDGYDTVLQEGAEDYRNDEEKMLKRATFEAEPLPASTPAPLECDVAFGNQPSCMTWKPVRPLEFECQTEKSAGQHAADRTRPDDGFHFPTWVRGKYLSVRFRITGIGGGGMFSAIHKLVKGWGQFDAP